MRYRHLFLAKRGQRPRVAGFIILSLKGLRRDEISCGVYGHVYLFLYIFIYLSVRLVYAGNDITLTLRWWPNGVRRRKTQIFGTEGRGFESCKVFFFFLLFLFFFFFCFRILSLSLSLSFFRFYFWIKIK